MRVGASSGEGDAEERILNVAQALFTKRGFPNVSIRDICTAAKVTSPTLYYHFKNKEGLFEAVVRKTVSMQEFIQRLKDECAKAADIKSKLVSFVRVYLSYFPVHVISVGLYVTRSTELDSIGTKTLLNELERIRSILIEIIREGVAKSEFRKLDIDMAAECLIGMLNRFIFERIHFGRAFNANKATQFLSSFFLKAIKPEAYRQ